MPGALIHRTAPQESRRQPVAATHRLTPGLPLRGRRPMTNPFQTVFKHAGTILAIHTDEGLFSAFKTFAEQWKGDHLVGDKKPQTNPSTKPAAMPREEEDTEQQWRRAGGAPADQQDTEKADPSTKPAAMPREEEDTEQEWRRAGGAPADQQDTEKADPSTKPAAMPREEEDTEQAWRRAGGKPTERKQ